MVTPPVFFDPSQQRWKIVKRILALLLILSMAMIFALTVSIFSVPALTSPNLLLPQLMARERPDISRQGNISNGNLQQQFQQAVQALNNSQPTPTPKTTLRPTLFPTLAPANPFPTPKTPILLQTISSPLASETATRFSQTSTVSGGITTSPPTPTRPQPTLPAPTNTSQFLPTATQGNGSPTTLPTRTPRPLPTNAQGHTPTPQPTNTSRSLPTNAQGHGTRTPIPTNPNLAPTNTQHPSGRPPTPTAGVAPISNLASLSSGSTSAAHEFFPILYHPALARKNSALSTDVNQPGETSDSLRIGFYVNWDDNADTSLSQNIQSLNRLMPEWLHLADANGTISDDNLAKENKILSMVRQKRPDLAIIPLVNSYDAASGQWNSQLLAQMLNNPAARGQAIQNLLEFVQLNHLQGISIDFEDALPDSQPGLQAFMQALYARFHPLGFEVVQVIPLASPSFDAGLYAQSCDYIILAAYDEHWSSGQPGPVASQGWFQAELKRRLSSLDPHKAVVALGNYGYDWTEKSPTALTTTFQGAMQSAYRHKSEVVFDPTSLNPTYSYVDETGQSHKVWYLDAATAFNQAVEGLRGNVRGFALWRLGTEDPSVWQVMAHLPVLNAQVAKLLKSMDFGDVIDYQGQGEVLKINGAPEQGTREISLESTTGQISSEKIVNFPSAYVITRWGRKEKEIALTFDDGPDPNYTVKVLDVLQKYKVPATFFIIGMNGEQYPGLLHQIVDAGYEIGVHTFTHPDISTISSEQLRLELNATQLLFESHLGIRSILFRPPYGIDAEPKSPEEVNPLLEISQLGYYTIGMQIDPGDWKKPGAQAIVDQTLNQISSSNGNIILLHDGGGDRSQTVEALPIIIETLQAQGYRFVAVSDLMGLDKSQVMPAVSEGENLQTSFGLLGFSFFGITTNISSWLFLACTIIGIGRMLFINILALIQWLRSDNRKYKAGYQPRVSVLVPAFNEAKVINKTVHSLLNSTYPNLEIIVIDDGSSDDTYLRVATRFSSEPRLRVFTKENGGKAHALNFGLQQSTGEIIVVLDADTIILPQAITLMVRHMDDPRVSAVAGNAKVGNRTNPLLRMQALEYITSQNMDRRAFALLNCISVVPGAIGAWRKEKVLQVGGFKSDTLAEDADLTLNILRTGVRIEYEVDAIALTEAPDTLHGFLKQRFRWIFGMLQTTWKQRDVLFRPRYGTMGLVALPNILIFSILLPIVAPIMDLTFLWSLINWVVYRFQHPSELHMQYLATVLEFYAFFLIVDLFTTLLAFLMESKEDWRLVLWMFPQRLFYRQLMYYTAIKATLSAVRGQIVGWGKLERKATVKLN